MEKIKVSCQTQRSSLSCSFSPPSPFHAVHAHPAPSRLHGLSRDNTCLKATVVPVLFSSATPSVLPNHSIVLDRLCVLSKAEDFKVAVNRMNILPHHTLLAGSLHYTLTACNCYILCRGAVFNPVVAFLLFRHTRKQTRV